MNVPVVCEEAAAAAAMAALRSNTLPFTPAGGWGGPVPALASSRVARVEQSTWSVFAVCEKESEVRSENDSKEEEEGEGGKEETYRRDEGGLGALEAPRERHPRLHDLVREGGGVSVVEDLRRPPQHRQDVPENPSCHLPVALALLLHCLSLRTSTAACGILSIVLIVFAVAISFPFCRLGPEHSAEPGPLMPSPMVFIAFRLVTDHAPARPPEIFKFSDWIRLAWKVQAVVARRSLLWVVDGEDGD